MSAHYDYDYESDAMTSETTDSADWSDSSSTDLDQTVHTGRKGALGSNRTGGGRKSVVGNKGGVKIPDPLYSVRIPTSTKFLGMNLDMNRVYGYKVIEVKGAAMNSGVEVGDLLVDVNGHTIKGFIDLRSLFVTEENSEEPGSTFNTFSFVRLPLVKKLGARRLRKVFPVARREHLDALIHDIEASQHQKASDSVKLGYISAVESEGAFYYDNEDSGMTSSESKDSEKDEYYNEESSSCGESPPVERLKGDFRGSVASARQRIFYNVH